MYASTARLFRQARADILVRTVQRAEQVAALRAAGQDVRADELYAQLAADTRRHIALTERIHPEHAAALAAAAGLAD